MDEVQWCGCVVEARGLLNRKCLKACLYAEVEYEMLFCVRHELHVGRPGKQDPKPSIIVSSQSFQVSSQSYRRASWLWTSLSIASNLQCNHSAA